MHKLIPTQTLNDGEVLQAKANVLILRKNVEYLLAEVSGESCELRLDNIASFSHPEIGPLVVS